MGDNELEELRLLKKSQYLALIELSDLTEQLARAVDRRDQVSVEMVLSMRQTPMTRLQEAEDAIRAKLPALPEETAIRLSALLNGGEAACPEEAPLCDQVARNTRLLEKITALDRRISERLGGRRSIYHTFREEPAHRK